MRGLFFRQSGSLANLTVEELPMPTPQAGEVLVKITAAAINPSDVKNVRGKMSQTKLPRVPGRDFAGRVVSGDSQWHGRSVFGTGGDLGFIRDGSHAEFMAVPVAALVDIPPGFSDEIAGSIGVALPRSLRCNRANWRGEEWRNRAGHGDHGWGWVSRSNHCPYEGCSRARDRNVAPRAGNT